ncbi:hypothetical protein Purlil1_13258 [Purpureocillium lilacinum]|uniref:Uncharacterized protein n=1 Tax=Purpureocillium lilacinum TaxID=33203 RepID=A0ABR0BEM9_PURLI|nr:hypothetical protein Purlil1_13258 [Purpureocillium lilacinum]
MSELDELVRIIERWTPESPDSPSFRLIQRCTLAFIKNALPCWPILLPKQLQCLFRSYHGYRKLPRSPDMSPGYQAFSCVLAIGHFFSSFSNHYDPIHLDTLLGLGDGIRPAAEILSATGINCPVDDVTYLQALALRDLYAHYRVEFGPENVRSVQLLEGSDCQVYNSCWDSVEDWWRLTTRWTVLNLQREMLWHVASPTHPGSRPDQFPDASCFIAVFGTTGWDHFFLKTYQTLSGRPPQAPPAVSLVHPPEYDRYGLTEVISSNYTDCEAYLHSIFDPNIPTADAYEPAARRCVSAIRTYLQEIQTLRGADRLFHGRREYQFVNCVIMASAAGLLTSPASVDYVDELLRFYGEIPAKYFVFQKAYAHIENERKRIRLHGDNCRANCCREASPDAEEAHAGSDLV